MLRFFQLVSDALSYSSNEATASFNRKSNAPAAIIGIDGYASDRQFLLKNDCDFIKVAGRQYNAGAFPLGLLTPTPPAAPQYMAAGDAYFPGTAIRLPNGRTCGAIAMNPNEAPSVKVTDKTAGSAALSRIVLHCVEFAEDCADAHENRAAFERLRRGIGEVYFVGQEKAYAAAGSDTLEATPTPPNARALRRLGVRGAAFVTSGFAVAETDFGLLQAKLRTRTNRAPHNLAVPARAIIGHGALEIPGAGMVDLAGEKGDEKAMIDLEYPTPGAGRTAKFLSIFEGRDPTGERLNASTAIS